MINYIEVTNNKGESILLDITNPWETGFVVENITGLDPGKATINVSDVSTIDGGRFNSARYSKRTATLYLRFFMMDGVTIEELRHKCYRFFTVKQRVVLTIKTDDRYVKTEGYVQSLESTIFSKSEGATVTLICPDPFLYNADPDQVTEFDAVNPLFEFPFSNESTSSNLIEMSELTVNNYRTIKYDGDHESGLTFYIHATGTVENLKITNADTGDSIGIDHGKLTRLTGYGIMKGDDIEICTERGKKYVKLIRNDIPTNIINCLMPDSKWLQL